jgi:hypothetical protein
MASVDIAPRLAAVFFSWRRGRGALFRSSSRVLNIVHFLLEVPDAVAERRCGLRQDI